MSAVRRRQLLTPAQNAALSSSNPESSAPNAAQRGRADNEKEQLKGLCHSWYLVRLGQRNCICRPVGKTAAFGISYAFTVVAFAAQIVIWKSALGRAEPLKSKFLGFPIVHIGIVYLVVQVIAFAVFLFIPTLPVWSAVVACAAIAGVFAVCLITSDVGRSEIERVSAKAQEKTFYIKQLQVDVELLAGAETDTATKSALTRLAEKIRYSDPMSDGQLADIEDRITVKFAELKSATDKVKIIAELNLLLDERNKTIKILK